MTVDTLLVRFGFKKVKNPDGVCKSVRRYVAGTKNGHLTGPLWACVKMTVDTLLAHLGFQKVKNPDGVCKSVRRYVAGTKNGHLIGALWSCVKITVDTLMGPVWSHFPVQNGHP